MSCHSLLACSGSAEIWAVNLMGIPLYVICCFSLAVFNIFSLYLIFYSLINICFGVFLFGFILYGTLCTSWTWLTISIPMLGNFSSIISANILYIFLYISIYFLYIPYNSNVGAFNVVPEVSETALNSLHSSVISWWFRSVLFSLHVFVCFIVFFL